MKVNYLFTMFQWTLYILGGLIFLTFISLKACKVYARSSTKIKSSEAISSLEKISLNGMEQWILIRGMNINNPILIFLPGGPGEPALGMSSSRKLDSNLINHFTVVHWDRFGTGKSYKDNIPYSLMMIDRWLDDCNELIDSLRIRFSQKKVFLVAHSGGTIFGLKMAHKYPEKLYAYVGVSQIVNNYERQKISYDFILEQAKKSCNIKKQKAILEIGPPPYNTPDKEFEKAKIIMHYGGFIHDNLFKGMAFVMLSYLTSPEYSYKNAINTISGKGLKFTMNSMYDELNKVDFNLEIDSVKTPVYFFQGKYDMITPTVQIESLYQNINAKNGKRLIMFEKSAHMLIFEEKELYQDLLINTLLKENHNK